MGCVGGGNKKPEERKEESRPMDNTREPERE
jgi:hypothetical protein